MGRNGKGSRWGWIYEVVIGEFERESTEKEGEQPHLTQRKNQRIIEIDNLKERERERWKWTSEENLERK